MRNFMHLLTKLMLVSCLLWQRLMARGQSMRSVLLVLSSMFAVMPAAACTLTLNFVNTGAAYYTYNLTPANISNCGSVSGYGFYSDSVGGISDIFTTNGKIIGNDSVTPPYNTNVDSIAYVPTNSGFSGTDSATVYFSNGGPWLASTVNITMTGGTPAPSITSVSPSSGSALGGANVVITGTNFTGATAVKFGASNASSFTVTSATQITATAPSGSGTVHITVVNGGVTSATSGGDQYTYIAA
ncbi:IPT/TIG domain-containing protein, partial [Undibacterium sp. CCC3.4]|uniref:IPT/TIG domain-containing protein n=1 Tax=Undibacterium sp. CCC3.4 TaxID=3048609 RepID=UPI002B2242D0